MRKSRSCLGNERWSSKQCGTDAYFSGKSDVIAAQELGSAVETVIPRPPQRMVSRKYVTLSAHDGCDIAIRSIFLGSLRKKLIFG